MEGCPGFLIWLLSALKMLLRHQWLSLATLTGECRVDMMPNAMCQLLRVCCFQAAHQLSTRFGCLAVLPDLLVAVIAIPVTAAIRLHAIEIPAATNDRHSKLLSALDLHAEV